jgi:hypothetical protein
VNATAFRMHPTLAATAKTAFFAVAFPSNPPHLKKGARGGTLGSPAVSWEG